MTGKPLLPSRREQLLAQAKLAERLEPVAQRVKVNKLIFESVLSGACTSVEILEAAYGDPQGHRYWELWLSERLPIYQFAELLALDRAATNGISVLDLYLLQIFERLRAAAEAGETWFIGDTAPLITETWSSLALRNSALAVCPQEAIEWMCRNPNARHLVPATPAEIAGSIVSINSPSPVSALLVVVPVGSAGLPAHKARREKPSASDAALDAEINALRNPIPPAEPAVAGVRRRGPRPIKLEQTKEKMRRDIQESRITSATLNDMLEKTLASTYGVSRETARNARKEVLSEIAEKSNSDK